MKIIDKIRYKEELEEQIDEFLSNISHYYRNNSPHWVNNPNRHAYSNISWEEASEEGYVKIGMTTSWHDYASFEISNEILHVDHLANYDEWKHFVDKVIDEENRKLELKSKAQQEANEAKELELLAQLKEKYEGKV